MRRTLIIILFFFSACGTSDIHGQDSRPTPATSPISSSPSPQITQLPLEPRRTVRMEDPQQPSVVLSHYEANLAWGVLIFGLVIIALEIGVMLRLKKGWGLQSSRIVGITLVVVSALFLIVTGYSQEQTAPMIGLLGTITGFLLGKTASANEAD